MPIVELFLFGLTVPVFYIIGLITFIRWLSRHGRPAPTVKVPDLQAAAAELRLRASQYTGKVKAELLEAADALAQPVAPAEVGDQAPAVTNSPAPGLPHVPPAPASGSWQSMNLSDGLHSLDNINLLLFLGAFLVVVSAGIFVGYNFETLTGTFKTVFLAIFAAIFYGTGLVLYLQAPKLRPAGSTFTGIGLILLPLVGLAAYNFTAAHEYPHGLWFVTSVITLVAYIATLLTTRQTYVAYLMAFSSLSLFESGISLIGVPLYWYGWGMGLVALVLLSLSRWTGWWQDAAGSLSLSANLFIPVSIIFSLAVVPDQGMTQLGVTLGMAGIFYGYLATRHLKTQTGEVYWLLAIEALPAALCVGLWDTVDHGVVAAILVLVSFIYLWIERLAHEGLPAKWRVILGASATLLAWVAAMIEIGEPRALLGCCLAAAFIGGMFAWRLRNPALALLAILPALAIPHVLVHEVVSPGLGWGWEAAAYLAATPLFVYWRRLMRGWPASSDAVGASGYLLSLALALVAAIASGHLATLLVGLAVAGALYWLSYLEQRVEYMYVASAAKYLAFLQIVPLTNWPDAVYALIVIAVGGTSYVLGANMADARRGQALRYTSIIATLLGSLFGVSSTDSLSAIASLALGGGLLLAEARRQALPVVEEVAIAILLVAFDWFLSYNHIDQTQMYSIPWAAYFAYLAWRRRGHGHEGYDLFTALSLFALTVPIAGQALGDNGQLYGLELILIGLALVVAGSALHYKLVAWWGAGTLIIEVLYQMRDVIYALPKYLISAALGVGLLIVAIVLLQRRKDR